MLANIASLFQPVVWTLLGAVLLTVGDIVLRMWFASDLRSGFAIAFIVYVGGVFCMMMSFFGKNIAVATVAMMLLNVIVYLIIAHFMYGDELGLWKIAGISLGLLALAILELS